MVAIICSDDTHKSTLRKSYHRDLLEFILSVQNIFIHCSPINDSECDFEESQKVREHDSPQHMITDKVG